jgi:hypothetical protein
MIRNILTIFILLGSTFSLKVYGDILIKHPVFPVEKNDTRLAQRLLTEFSEKEFIEFVPSQSPRSGVISPASGKAHWDWNPQIPNQIICRDTGTVFPNDRYILKNVIGNNILGKAIEIPYYDSKYGRCFLQAQIDYQKKDFLDKCLLQLSAAYVHSGDERYAYRIALALDTWATYLPDYYLSDHSGTAPISLDEAKKLKWDVKRFSDHNTWAHEWPSGAVLAFDRIYESKSLQKLSQLRGYDVREHIIKDLFFNIGDFFVKRMPIETATNSNLSGPMVQLAQVATILSRPDYIEWLNHYLDATLDNFTRDGMYPESFGYHRGYANANLQVAEAVAHYFLVHKANNDVLRSVRDAASVRIAKLKRSVIASYQVALPNGDTAPFDDTPYGAAPERDITHSSLLPAYGHAMLGDGKDLKQTQVNLNFNDNANHIRAGVLGLTLYSLGDELIANNRYFHSVGRPYLNSTMGQNTVTIDRKSQDRNTRQTETSGNRGHLFTSGDLRMWEPGIDGISIVQVDGHRSYLNVNECRYERLCLLNTTDTDHPYILDLFRVSGGKTHDYFLNGSVRNEQTAEASFTLFPIPREHPLLLPNEIWNKSSGESDNNNDWYGVFRNVKYGKSPGNWSVTFRNTTDKIGVRMSFADDGESQIYLGEGPVPARFDDHVEHDTIYDFWRPVLMVRRQGIEGQSLQSLFLDVIEPFDMNPQISKIERIPLKTTSHDTVGVKITFIDGRTDICLINLALKPNDSKEISTTDGLLHLSGRVGILSHLNNGKTKAWLVGGNYFKAPIDKISLSASIYKGIIYDVMRRVDGSVVDALVCKNVLPEGYKLKGHWLSMNMGSYEVIPDINGNYPNNIHEQNDMCQMFCIDHIEKHDGNTWICLNEDPYIKIKDNKLVELLRPHRNFYGQPTFEILTSTTD